MIDRQTTSSSSDSISVASHSQSPSASDTDNDDDDDDYSRRNMHIGKAHRDAHVLDVPGASQGARKSGMPGYRPSRRSHPTGEKLASGFLISFSN